MSSTGSTGMAAFCGNGVVEPGEECDDQNPDDTDGCDTFCHFTCVSGDPQRGCAPAAACVTAATCSASHTCTAGAPLPDGSGCPGFSATCHQGVCTEAVCGNGLVEVGEACDDGVHNGELLDGCRASCAFACVNAAADCAAPPPCEVAQCNAGHVCQPVADASQNGASCGSNLVCNHGACIAVQASCGNGVKEDGEDCDFGSGNGLGTGCETNCTYSCTTAASCSDGNSCNGDESCVLVDVGGQGGQRCQAGAPLPDGALCPTGICVAQHCVASGCGDGVRTGAEECDDGNMDNLDGCDATCHFEQLQRINWFQMQFSSDTSCPDDALGEAVASNLAQQPLQQGLDQAIKDGSMSILLQYLDLDDLSGANDTMLRVGVLSGAPQTSPSATYNGANALDWWFTADASTLDVSRTPVQVAPATLASSVLSAGPASFVIPFNLGGAAPVAFSSARLTVKHNSASLPLAATGGHTPGHTPGEHLSPTLTSFATAGQQSGQQTGKLCGNASAASLAAIQVPSLVVQNCSSYSASSTMLDLIVGGCNAFGFLQLINPTQPDQVDPAVPALGAGGPYTLAASSGTSVNTCTDSSGAVVDFTQCLSAAAYSSYFKFTLQRAIVKP